MKQYILYSHAGSSNHGCEALVRTALLVIKNVGAVYSDDVEADKRYGIDNLVKLKQEKKEVKLKGREQILYSLKYKLFKSDKIYFEKNYNSFINDIDSDNVYVSIGGDNYCYHFSEWLEVLNNEINKRGAKSILWGCSINADELENKAVLRDLERYSLITARETITYDLLKNRLKKPRIEYVPDTAFLLPIEKAPLPDGFIQGKTIGLNVSPVILNNSKNNINMLNSFINLVNYIIHNTEYQIALIPHVVMEGNDDRQIHRKIYERCVDKNRVVLIEDANCCILKGCISRCNLFIGTRTHATIAAYSSFIPTLVVGYSVKSLGIAKDLFGTSNRYVLSVQDITEKEELIKSFLWLKNNQSCIMTKLKKRMPSYIKQIQKAKKYLEELD